MTHILCFLYVFNFCLIKGVPISESAIAVGGILCMYLLLNRNYQIIYLKSLRQGYHISVLGMWFLLFILSTLVTSLQGHYDFSFCKVLVHQIVVIEIGFLLLAYVEYKNEQKNIFDIIINIFFVQSLLITCSLVSPDFRDATNILRNDATIKISMSQYAGARGLAIAGSAFFGIAVPYGVVFLIIAFHWKKWKVKSLVVRCMILVVLGIGSLSAGRTALVGLLMAIVYFIITRYKEIRLSSKDIFELLILSVLGVLAIYAVLNFYPSNSAIDLLRRYSLEMITNFLNGKGFTSTSGASLRRMYIPLSLSQILIGDGLYTVNGVYYMRTDVGYIRGLLYFGIVGFLLLCIYQCIIIGRHGKSARIKKFKITLFLMLSVFELKGEVIGVLIMLQSLLLLLNLGLAYEKTQEKRPAINSQE